MKRARSEEIIKTLERLVSLESVPKDVLHQILMKSGLNVRDINALCSSTAKLRQLCKGSELWEKIYLRNVPGADINQWRGAAAIMPNYFLRFMAFHALSDEYGWKYQFESPSKAEAVVVYSEGEIVPKHKMPNGYQAAWEKSYVAQDQDQDSDIGSDENPEEDADMAFNEQFGDENGHLWEYIRYTDGRDETMQSYYVYGHEILALIDLGIVTRTDSNMTLAPPVHSMQHVFYSLMALGWTPVYPPEYPDIQCRVCSAINVNSMCKRCSAPICSNACLADDRHHC